MEPESKLEIPANTASGASALQANTTGRDNTASGVSALQFNTTGKFNTAIGASALVRNTTGESNTAVGVEALRSNADGSFNTLKKFGRRHPSTVIYAYEQIEEYLRGENRLQEISNLSTHTTGLLSRGA